MDDALNTHLTELEELIQRAQSDGEIDDAERAELAALVEKVRDDLTAEGESHGLDDRLAEAAVEFENEHPRLAGAIRQISDALSGYGI